MAHVASRAAGCQYCMAHTAEGALHFGVDEKRLAAASVPNGVTDEMFADLRRHWSENQRVLEPRGWSAGKHSR